MALVDLELDLSPEERAIRDTVHKFAAEVLRPAGSLGKGRTYCEASMVRVIVPGSASAAYGR
jgi:hypothetical protein